MRTIELNIYAFNELSETAKEKAIENLRDINVEFEWWLFCFEDAEQIGLKIESFDLERNRHAKGHFILAANEVAQNILNNHGESCETYKTAANFLEEWTPLFSKYMETEEGEDELLECEEEFLSSLLKDFSIILENTNEYLSSNEAIIETIEANEYEFTEDGQLN